MAYKPPHIKASKVGSLHKLLGIKQDNKIPAADLASKSSDSPVMAKKKNFARNARKWKHGGSSIHKLIGK